MKFNIERINYVYIPAICEHAYIYNIKIFIKCKQYSK